MSAYIEAYEDGHRSILAYCYALDLKVPTFHYWRCKFRDARNATPVLIPFLPPVADPAIAFLLEYPNRVASTLRPSTCRLSPN